jgi:hypothetical protein
MSPGQPFGPVGYASDPKRLLSATPSTPIGYVDGVTDRYREYGRNLRIRSVGAVFRAVKR